MPRTFVVIPTYNEVGNLPELLRQIMAQPLPGVEVLIVDDNSPDGTAQEAERQAERYGGRVHVLRRPGRMGLGTAYVEGFRWALDHGADYVAEMDADLSHGPEYLPALVSAMGDHDVAVGSRWTAGGGADRGWGLGRRALSRGGSLFARLVLGLKVKDATTGFKCFRREALQALDLGGVKSQGFAFQVEMAYACQRKGLRVVEVPIRFRTRARGRSKLSARIILEALWRVVAIRFRG